jgi:hypothetical protein
MPNANTTTGLTKVSDALSEKTYYINPANIACLEVWGTTARVWLTTGLMVSCCTTDPGIVQLL